jgi:hypothetical protein
MARRKSSKKAKRKAPKRKGVARRKPPKKKTPKKKRRKTLVPVSKDVLSGGIYAGDPTAGQISAPPTP